MKNNCLHKCLKEVDLDKYFMNFMSNGVTTCDLLTKISIDLYQQYGVIDVVDKLKLFELTKIIKSIQADLIKENKDFVKSKEEVSRDVDGKRCERSYEDQIGDCKESLHIPPMHFSNHRETDFYDLITENNNSVYSNSKEYSEKGVLLGGDSAAEEDAAHLRDCADVDHDNKANMELCQGEKRCMNTQNLLNESDSNNSIKLQAKNKTFNIGSNIKAKSIPVRQIKSNQSQRTISKLPLTISRPVDKSQPSIYRSKLTAVKLEKKVDAIFRRDEIQFSSTPIKPFSIGLIDSNSSTKHSSGHQQTLNISHSLEGANKLDEVSSDLSTLEVVSGHAPLFTRGKRNLNPHLASIRRDNTLNANNQNNDEDLENILNTDSSRYRRRRTTYDKATDQLTTLHPIFVDKSTAIENAELCETKVNIFGYVDIAQDIFSQTKSNTDVSRRNVLHTITSNEPITSPKNSMRLNASPDNLLQPITSLHNQLIESSTYIRAMGSPVTTDDIHLDTLTYFRPIHLSQIASSLQLTSEDKDLSPAECFNAQTSEFHPNYTLVKTDINCNTNSNINLNEGLADADADSISGTTSSNVGDAHRAVSANPQTDASPNKRGCVRCLEDAHEQQLSDVTNLSSLEMQALIRYKHHQISMEKYLTTIKQLLNKKLDCISNMLQTCNHFHCAAAPE